MDLDNMKEIWSEMSGKLEKSKLPDNKGIIRMINKKSMRRLNKMILVEILGIMGAFLCVGFMLWHFSRFDHWITLTGALCTIMVCILSVLLSVDFIRKAKKIDILKNSFKQTLIDFTVCNHTYQSYKRLNNLLGMAALIFICPVVFKFTRNADVISDVPFSVLLTYLIGGGLASLVLTFLIYRLHDRQMNEIKDLLKDLEE